jgi:hypothetical protein
MPKPRPSNERAPEITPEMIEAGEEYLFSFDPAHDYAEDYLRRIFLAMEAARNRVRRAR